MSREDELAEAGLRAAAQLTIAEVALRQIVERGGAHARPTGGAEYTADFWKGVNAAWNDVAAIAQDALNDLERAQKLAEPLDAMRRDIERRHLDG
jgi:hypothetical protein